MVTSMMFQLSTKEVLKTVYTYKRELSGIKQPPIDETWLGVLKDLVPNNNGVYKNSYIRMSVEMDRILFSLETILDSDTSCLRRNIHICINGDPNTPVHNVTIEYDSDTRSIIDKFFPIIAAKIDEVVNG